MVGLYLCCVTKDYEGEYSQCPIECIFTSSLGSCISILNEPLKACTLIQMECNLLKQLFT